MSDQEWFGKLLRRRANILYVRQNYDSMRTTREQFCSQAEVAKQLGIAQPIVSKLEKGLLTGVGYEVLDKAVALYKRLMEMVNSDEQLQRTGEDTS